MFAIKINLEDDVASKNEKYNQRALRLVGGSVLASRSLKERARELCGKWKNKSLYTMKDC